MPLRKKNMSFLVYYLILHLCLHACNSRHLGVFHKEPGKEFSLIITSKTLELMAELEGRRVINEHNTHEQKESKLEFPSNADKLRRGIDMKGQISQEENKILVEWKNSVRSTMESKLQDSNEDINKSKDSSVTEDVAVMDYAQPHRKPPIHNIAP